MLLYLLQITCKPKLHLPYHIPEHGYVQEETANMADKN